MGMSRTVIDNLERVVERARAAPEGGRPPTALGDPLPWDFEGRARVLALRADTVLDLTAGAGELLEGVIGESDPETRPLVLAADRRARHLEEAHARLGDRALLLRASPQAIPFRPGAVDLALLRHRPFNARQLAALVRPGGAILTEQVHASNWRELREYFPRAAAPPDDLEENKKVLRRAGFDLIDVRAHDRPLAFDDLDHLVHTLALAPWIVPDFSIAEDVEALLALEADLEDERGIVITRSRYVLEVRRAPPLE